MNATVPNAHMLALGVMQALLMDSEHDHALSVVKMTTDAVLDIEVEYLSTVVKCMKAMHEELIDAVPADSEIGHLVAAGLKFWTAVSK